MSITITYDELTDITDHATIDGDQLVLNYSGRGMNGRTCLGITGSTRDFGMFAVALTEREIEAAEADTDLGWTAGRIIDRVSADSMGHDRIFYFPGVTVTEVPAHVTS